MSRFTTMRPTPASSALRLTALLAAPLAALLAALLAGCTAYSPGDLRPGRSEAEIRARMGEPNARQALPDGGARLEYARGPMGRHTYLVEVDSAGRLRGWEQVLTEANFDAIAIGVPQAAVQQKLGRASQTRVGWRGVGEVWSYRYESLFCRWFQVWLVEGRVREASFASDPMCEEARRDVD